MEIAKIKGKARKNNQMKELKKVVDKGKSM